MKYRALTVSREYGSGGAEIAEIIAQDLGWRLVDKELILEISRMEQLPASEVAEFDERVDTWLHRLTNAIWSVAADGVSPIVAHDMFNAEKAAQLARRVIEEAYRIGRCVIVGRGAQCVLRGREDVFHAFVYADWQDKVNKIRSREPQGTDVEALIRSTDSRRIEYIRRNYRENWLNPHLYDIMINSRNQPRKTAHLIIAAMQPEPVLVR